MRTLRVGAVGVLLTTPVSYALSDPYCAELLRGIGEITDRTGRGLVLIPVTSTTAGDDISVDGVRQAVIDGAIADGRLLLRGVFGELHAIPLRDTVSLSNVADTLDPRGRMVPSDHTDNAVAILLRSLHWWGHAMRHALQHEPHPV